METVELGAARLHLHVAWPGIPGEGDTLRRIVAQVDPAMVLLDVDTKDALALRRGRFEPQFVDELFSEALVAQFGKGDPAGEHPWVGVAQAAHKAKAALVALRPHARGPWLLARRRARQEAARIHAPDAEAFSRAFAVRLHDARIWSAQEDAEAAVPRLERALADGRAPVLAISPAHRAPALLAAVRTIRRVRA